MLTLRKYQPITYVRVLFVKKIAFQWLLPIFNTKLWFNSSLCTAMYINIDISYELLFGGAFLALLKLVILETFAKEMDLFDLDGRLWCLELNLFLMKDGKCILGTLSNIFLNKGVPF